MRTATGDVDLTYDDSRTTDQIRPAVDLNRLFLILASSARRRVLFEVLECSPREIRTMSERFAATWDIDRERVRTQLRHVHLPKLNVAGYVRWNEATGEIARGPSFEELEPLLRLLDDNAEELPGGWP